jgi:putative tryptophan/tyrosine transport system substrate-binding protein
MNRREFITLLGGVAAAWPLASRAQQGERVRRIGVLCVRGPEPLGPFREALGDLGYLEGKNIRIEVRSAQGQDTRLAELAAELVRSRVDVIVAVQTPAAHAAKNATRDIHRRRAGAGRIGLEALAYVEEDGLLLSVALLAAIILIGVTAAAVLGTIVGAVLISDE